MKTNKRNLRFIWLAAIVAIVLPGTLLSQNAALKSSTRSNASTAQRPVQVKTIDSADKDLAPSFRLAIYENLLEELNKTRKFKTVLRDGDRKASDIPDLLILRTTVVKYTRGSETRRAVTTVRGATELTVRTQVVTVDGETIFDRTVHGNVRFFGSNLRATLNLARNIAKTIERSNVATLEASYQDTQSVSLDSGATQ